MTFGDFYSKYCGKEAPEKDLVRLCWIEAQQAAVNCPLCKEVGEVKHDCYNCGHIWVTKGVE